MRGPPPITMLYDPARHEALAHHTWDEGRARECIGAIVADIEDALGDDITWPAHPLDEPDDARERHKSLYLGSAGVLWALWRLQQCGFASVRLDPRELIARTNDAYLAQPDTGEVVSSYFLGEAGILAVAYCMTGEPRFAQRLRAVVAGNIGHPTNEALWGAPGTMVAALHLLEWTGDDAWRELVLANVDDLWISWKRSPHAPCHLWTQDLYGKLVQLVGAGHGFAGNVYPLLRAAALLAPEVRQTLYARCVETLRATGRFEQRAANWAPANWPQGVGTPRPGRTEMLVQWCHGAPGIVTSFAPFPAGESAELDEMLLQAGETVWEAGPLAKGFGLCHGTAGNGLAFLVLHARTRHAMWLERARRFAMHAIGQYEAMRERHGRGRFTLWTGDAGLALYLAQCVEARPGVPSLDYL
jgi:lanthionine synthetase-like protein